MINLYDFEKDLQFVIKTIKNIFDIDSAIFDLESNLVASTDSYVKSKGKTVHAPSIQEVVLKETVTVNNPGHMPSCMGCRFKDNCPSTIEILKSIKSKTEPYGVLSLTSFTKEGHDKIVKNIEYYINIVQHFSELLSLIIMQKYKSNDSKVLNNSFITAADLMDDGLIVTDTNGNIETINKAAIEFFSSCGMYTKSIQQLFPDDILNVIFSGRIISNYKFKINDIFIRIFSTPIKNNDIITGFAIRISYSNLNFRDGHFYKNEKFINSIENIKGKSNHVTEIKSKIKKIANSPSTVFITGETGTGKSMLAKVIHNESHRKNKPFVAINCASIPETLFESELFGYESGAFTGAKKEGKPGKFELANEGTLFLDEISELPLNMQSKLLYVLQESTFERVGGISPITVDVRIITASNKDLEELIKEKKFRSDLYYRINVIPMHLIPLKERSEDINILTNEYLKFYNKKLNKQILGFSNEVIKIFNNRDWPGNIRQLENVIEYCVNMTNNEVITEDDLPQNLKRNFNELDPKQNKLKTSEYQTIIETIDKYGWDVNGKTKAAKELGIGLRTLYRKLNDFK